MTSEEILKKAKTFTDIPSVVKHWADTQPEKEVFVFFNESGRTAALTAGDVYLLAGRFATRLRNCGFQRGDLISNAIPNSSERIVTDFGIMMAGCIGSNCQIMEKDGSDFWKNANCCESAGIILPNHHGNKEYSVLQPFLPSDIPPSRCVDVTIPEVPSMKRAILVDRHGSHEKNLDGTHQLSFLDSLREGREEIYSSQEETSPDSIVYVFGTSGTTGFSKMCPRDHKTALSTARIYESGDPSIRISKRPLGWIGGFPFSFLANSTCTLIQDLFEGKSELGVKQFWDIVEKERCSSGFMMPEEISTLLRYFRDNPPKHRLKVIISGGKPLTKNVCDALGVITDALVIAYASTEMTFVSNMLVTHPDQMQDFLAGNIVPGVFVKIVNDRMEELDKGKEGIVLVKSPFGSNHYYKQTFVKPTCTEDGYFITGDRGWVNQDGLLFVAGRNDDVIFNRFICVYPSWVESILTKIPGVSEAGVLGVPHDDPTLGDKICACVVLQPDSTLTKESLIQAYNESFAETETDDYYFPKLTHLEIFISLPKGFTDKVAKSKLREMLLERLL